MSTIERVLTRSERWQRLAERVLRLLCFALGYPLAALQFPSIWIVQYEAAIRVTSEKGVRRKCASIGLLSRRRNGVVVMLLYLGAQHARVQFHFDACASKAKPKDVRPYRILDCAHHRTTRLLARLLGAAVGCKNQGYGRTGLAKRAVRRILRWLMGPGDPDISVYAAMRWLAVADIAAGVAPRRPDSLQKAHNNVKAGPLSALMWSATRAYIRDTYFPGPLRSARFFLLGVGNLLALYYLVRLAVLAVQHIAHALA